MTDADDGSLSDELRARMREKRQEQQQRRTRRSYDLESPTALPQPKPSRPKFKPVPPQSSTAKPNTRNRPPPNQHFKDEPKTSYEFSEPSQRRSNATPRARAQQPMGTFRQAVTTFLGCLCTPCGVKLCCYCAVGLLALCLFLCVTLLLFGQALDVVERTSDLVARFPSHLNVFGPGSSTVQEHDIMPGNLFRDHFQPLPMNLNYSEMVSHNAKQLSRLVIRLQYMGRYEDTDGQFPWIEAVSKASFEAVQLRSESRRYLVKCEDVVKRFEYQQTTDLEHTFREAERVDGKILESWQALKKKLKPKDELSWARDKMAIVVQPFYQLTVRSLESFSMLEGPEDCRTATEKILTLESVLRGAKAIADGRDPDMAQKLGLLAQMFQSVGTDLANLFQNMDDYTVRMHELQSRLRAFLQSGAEAGDWVGIDKPLGELRKDFKRMSLAKDWPSLRDASMIS